MNRLSSTLSIMNGSLNVDYLYSENFSYDAQGNITSLERWDEDDKMDHLSFTYDGNQVHSIDEHGFGACLYDTKEYHNNSNSNNDFAYDANGNMIYDQDRNIAAIRYNLLNLPDTIQFMNGNLIIHLYDATGNRLETKYLTKKIATTVPLGNVLSTPKRPEFFYITRDAFCNNVVYTANNKDPYGIEFVHNPEGYIRYYGPEEHYHFYYIKDLLGNIRETYVHPEAGYKECIQRMQYYPSGLPWAEAAGSSEQPWKYNGKEFVEMHGLDEYDSKARWYYPAICRTTTMDPLAEKYYSTSPYAWCGNNPVIFTDANGCWFDFSGMTDEEKTVFDSNIDFLKENMMFQRLYSELEESPEKYSILYGETTYLDEHNVDGQFVPSKNGGGTITFLSGKQIDGSVAAEEFFHAYQHHNRNFYANGEFNREFEAKTFVTILGINAGWGYIGYSGMTDFQSNIMQGIYLTKGYNTVFENDYMIYANQYAEHNKRANYGNSNYQTSSSVLPFSLKKLLNFLNFE